MQILAAVLKNSVIRIFSFDFRMFCGILKTGRAQAACSSHKEVAPSTFSHKKRSEVTRAQGFTHRSLTAILERPLQMPRWTQIFAAVNLGFGRAKQTITAAPALFHGLALGCGNLCAISGYSLTVRAMETRARLAALVRPEIQKVRIC